jgi:hypothetical protein
MFAFVRDLLRNGMGGCQGKAKQAARDKLYEPIFERLGFRAVVNRPCKTDLTKPDYLLNDASGETITAAFVYSWDRWLDGPDIHDADTPEENPGASVVTALDEAVADWIIVTNGRLWRLYSRHAHARATNYYEVDLVEALTASGDTDPNEAFRYWWLFFRPDAYRRPADQAEGGSWLDAILQGSRDYAKRLGDRLKDRIFVTIFPHLAQGFLADRRGRLKTTGDPTRQELDDIFQATLTLLYRLLFLLYAESRDLLPMQEAPYQAASLKKLKDEIAEKAGVALDEVPARLERAYSETDTGLHGRLAELFTAMDKGDPVRNVPTYNGGLFNTEPDDSDRREQRIARFLRDHKIPDRFLALAIDRLSRDQDERTLGLVPIDYKSLEVRHLGSIYEGLLEFKLILADEDKTTKTEKGQERYISLSEATTRRGRQAEIVVQKGQVYLSNDKADRKASGSYYTPDSIVEYIVAETVGPVLDEKLESLRADFRRVRKFYDNELQKATAYPPPGVSGKDEDATRRFAVEKTYHSHKDLVDRLFDLKVLDPAMGSGHFLVEAVDYITDRLLKFLSAFPINPVGFALDRTRNSILQSLGDQGVTVDPAKLTDINLLKRHVLKRCIYGVDLNPMAVELAKVSLWLDAFTLGAPLSFLDHHLRCGNSLVGATFADLEEATSGRLFRLDYEPLLRAINYVLLVSKVADTTAAEVAHSVSQYYQARRALSGYQIVLDLLVAEHFGMPQAKALVTEGDDLDLADKERFKQSLTDDRERLMVGNVEALAHRPDRRFFHWEIEFPEVFFGFPDGSDRQIQHKDRIEPGSGGFDVVVGNPPYDVLAEKELETDLEEILGYFNNEAVFEPACKGKQNLYKLFICRGVQVLRRRGRIGHIVPMALLGDDQAVGVRKLLLANTSIRAIEAFPQKDDARNRVFEDAKLSTCIFISAKSSEDAKFRSRVHPGKHIDLVSPSLHIRRNSVKLYDPENQPIVACSQEDWDLAVKIMSSGRMRRLGNFATAYQGEVNETTDGNKGNISQTNADGPQILRGSNVCMYLLRNASQGEPIYLRKEKFLKDKRPNAKAWHHKQNRVIFQRNSPQNNFRRLIACPLPSGHFCCDTISYFPEQESKLPLQIIVALFNSKLLDWFFRLGSTNSKVNDYQVQIFPIPWFGENSSSIGPEQGFQDNLIGQNWEGAIKTVEPFMNAPPFDPVVMACMIQLVEAISRIEANRGDIVRTERSALAPQAQPYQDLLDKMLFRLAGLTDAEVEGLEERLAGML